MKRKRWSPLSRARARDMFWAPVREQANAIIQQADGWLDYDTIPDHIDPLLFGKRWDNPVYRRALLKILREDSSLYIAA